MSKDATGASASHFLKRLFDKIRNFFSFESHEESHEESHDFLLAFYAHCFACVMKSEECISEKGIEEAKAYIHRKFATDKVYGDKRLNDDTRFVLDKFEEYLLDCHFVTSDDALKFVARTSYKERLEFAEELVALAKTCQSASKNGDRVDMNNFLSRLIRLFGLKKNHVYTLLRTYRIRESDNNRKFDDSKKRDSCNEKVEKTENDKYRSFLTKTHITYAYCLACVVKADGVVTEEERKKAENFIASKFYNNIFYNALIQTFNRFLNKNRLLSPKVHRDFLVSTSIPERYAFTEMLFSLAMTNDNFPTDGITGNLARVLSELMTLFELEERDIEYLSNKYKLSVPDDSAEKESDKKEQSEDTKDVDEDKSKTFAYCFAAVVKADGNVSNEERRRVGEYMTANFSNPSVAIAYFNRLVNGRSTPSLSIPKEFILITSYHERYAFIETLLSFTLLNLENNENGSNNNGSGVVLKLMKLFELQESDIQYLCNKFHIREPKQKKSKESDKRYTEYKNKDQRANSGRKSKQYQQGSQYNNQQQQEQQQQESRVERRQKKLEYAYAVLGLSSSATPDEIRKAYRSLALKYHPDTVQEDFLKLELTEKFKEINWAYSLLKQ